MTALSTAVPADRDRPASVRGARRLERRPPPDLADRLRRAAWSAAWAVLFRPSPVVCRGWRRMLLRLWGATVADGAVVYPSTRIFAPWNVSLGRRATIAGGVDLYSVGRIIVGDDAIVSQRAFLCSATHDRDAADFCLLVGPITIGRNGWIAAEAFVGPGITVGENAVVGARSVVTRDVPPSAVVAGNPARIVGSRAAAGRNTLR